jgi:hypothetical protein
MPADQYILTCGKRLGGTAHTSTASSEVYGILLHEQHHIPRPLVNNLDFQQFCFFLKAYSLKSFSLISAGLPRSGILAKSSDYLRYGIALARLVKPDFDSILPVLPTLWAVFAFSFYPLAFIFWPRTLGVCPR